jgi:multidrug efflux pump subunit AcrB
MNLGEYSIAKKTITLVFTVGAVIAGMQAYNNLGRLEDPEFTIKDALITTAYPGASAAEVEKEVSNTIEKAVQEMGQLKRVKSMSMRGLSVVTATMKDKYDKKALPQVWDELRRKVGDAQGQLPPGAGPSVVNDDFGDVYGVYIAITGDGYSQREIKDFANFLRRELLLVQDVKRIAFWGAEQEAIFVEMNREKLANLGISQQQIYDQMKAKNLVSNAGRAKVGPEYLAIEPTGEFESEEDLRNLLISDPGSGAQIYLGDVAEIYRGYLEPPNQVLRESYKTYWKGNKKIDDQTLGSVVPSTSEYEVRTHHYAPAIGLAISTVDGGNVVTMGNALVERFQELKPQIPLGMQVHVISNQAASVEQSVNGFMANLIAAVVIVVVVLLFFMGLKSGILIGAVLFITICASFIVMDYYSILLERISLGALIIALGMLVDNAIVVTEGMKVRIESGQDKRKAAREVVGQNQYPLLGATFVAVLAFGAIGLSQDSTGEYCRSLFQVLLISLLMSWVTAVTITPLFCVMAFRKTQTEGDEPPADPYGGLLFRVYRSFLETAIRFRWLTTAVVIILFIASVYGFGFLKNSFFPPSTRPQFMVDLWLPEGTHIRETEKVAGRLADYAMSFSNTQSVATHVGNGALRFLLTYAPEKMNSAYAQLLVNVFDSKQIDEMSAKLEGWMNENLVSGMGYTKKFMLGPGEGGKIQIRLSGPSADVLRALSREARTILEEDGGAKALRSDWGDRVKVIQPAIAETQARRLGIDRPMVATTLEASFDGNRVGIFRESDEVSEDRILPIVARPPEKERGTIDSIYDLSIFSPAADRMIPMRQVLTGFETTFEDPIIWRRNRIPTLTLHCDPVRGEASELLERVRERIETLVPAKIQAGQVSPDYFMEWGGEFESSRDAQAALSGSIPMFVAIMVLIVIMLFNNLRQPLIIFLTVPLALIGITFGLLLFDQPFGFMALLGALSLSGMLIKNAIVLIDQININAEAGMAPYEAVIDSGVSRMRPVMMAAATTVLGLLPLLADAFFIAMAVTIMFGLSFATVLTLIFVPVLYTMFYGIKKGA